MTELNYRVAVLMLCLLAVALVAYGFVLGFGAFLSLATGIVLLCKWYWPVACRPRVAVAVVGKPLGVYFGEIYMEVI